MNPSAKLQQLRQYQTTSVKKSFTINPLLAAFLTDSAKLFTVSEATILRRLLSGMLLEHLQLGIYGLPSEATASEPLPLSQPTPSKRETRKHVSKVS
jgi:hypothetical protein